MPRETSTFSTVSSSQVVFLFTPVMFYPLSKVSAEEKLRAVQGKEAELQQLRQSLRERDRLIEKMNSAVLETEEKNKVCWVHFRKQNKKRENFP